MHDDPLEPMRVRYRPFRDAPGSYLLIILLTAAFLGVVMWNTHARVRWFSAGGQAIAAALAVWVPLFLLLERRVRVTGALYGAAARWYSLDALLIMIATLLIELPVIYLCVVGYAWLRYSAAIAAGARTPIDFLTHWALLAALAVMIPLGLLALWLRRYTKPRWLRASNRCGGCAYPLHGLMSERCPECGASIGNAK